jgi:hypothetical protein
MRIAGQRRVLQQVWGGGIDPGPTTCSHSKSADSSRGQILQHLRDPGDGPVLQQVWGGHARPKRATRGSAGTRFRHADASLVNAN